MTPEQESFTPEQIEQLNRPLRESLIRERDGGGGKKFKYIKADAAIDAANRIFGYGKWGYKIVARGKTIIKGIKNIYENTKVVGKEETYKVMYTVELELYVVGAAFPITGDGVGTGDDASILEHEKAYKEASSDALKRALRHYGDQFGLSLYDQDDLIEMENGDMKRVGDVKVSTKPPQQNNRAPVQAQQPKAMKPRPSQNPEPEPIPTKLEDDESATMRLRDEIVAMKIPLGEKTICRLSNFIMAAFAEEIAAGQDVNSYNRPLTRDERARVEAAIAPYKQDKQKVS